MKFHRYPLSIFLLLLFFSKASASSSINIELVGLEDHFFILVTGSLDIEELFGENDFDGIRMSTEPSLDLGPDYLEIELNSENRTDLIFYATEFEAELPVLTSSRVLTFDKHYHTKSCDYLSVELNGSSVMMKIDENYAENSGEGFAFFALSEDHSLDDFDSPINDDGESYSWSNTINDEQLTISFSVTRVESMDDFFALLDVVSDAFEGSDDLGHINTILATAYPAAGYANFGDGHYHSWWMHGGSYGRFVYLHDYRDWAVLIQDDQGNTAYLYLHGRNAWLSNKK
ncbi:hypothetical protein [Rubellicoccus peritrichatus]|uniref:Uncharacterized protein n=1 Tax=Rubellicoccus peritrichatus TaxID=3080537 RepID=A0AAQ3QY16_9BACT|nr:hypothetical protein [Puniceicoccus sp. CR14]WOO43365.1 hypothetical protein RZN69_09720 [Puniceicoccus sp. CR14]